MNQAAGEGAAKGEGEEAEGGGWGVVGGGGVTSPRERPRIRNFLVCVFLAQVKWIAPISALRGQLHYMKETVTLNVTPQQPRSSRAARLPGRRGDNNHP